MRKQKLGIIIAILLIAIGFAAVTTTLYINGNLTIRPNNDDFNSNVIFTKAKTDDNSIASISTDGKTITFNARDLSTLGDEVILDFVVKNNSRQYDADAVINCDYDNKENNYNEYTNITINPSEFNLPATESQDGKLKVRLIKSFVGDDEGNSVQITFSCRIDANAKERDNLAEAKIEPINVDAFNYITDLADNNPQLLYDGTGDNNLRYVGENPNNYVEFNNELWRIIGLMNNIEDEYGNKGSYLKIIRDESIGKYAFDIKKRNTLSDSSNDYSTSTIMKTLNEETYFNKTSGLCAINTYPESTYTTECDFSEIGLSDDAKRLIAKVVWPLGSLLNSNEKSTELTANDFYLAERGENVYSGHATKWLGYVGLIHVSDFGFTVAGEKREACLASSIISNLSLECYKDTWLSKSQWAITPSTYGSNQHYIYSDFATTSHASSTHDVRPVVFLYQNIKIMGGLGTKDNPYLLG